MLEKFKNVLGAGVGIYGNSVVVRAVNIEWSYPQDSVQLSWGYSVIARVVNNAGEPVVDVVQLHTPNPLMS